VYREDIPQADIFREAAGHHFKRTGFHNFILSRILIQSAFAYRYNGREASG
jgi:hypothetical protein